MSTVAEAPVRRPVSPKLASELRAFEMHRAEWVKSYPDRFVAIHEGRIVCSSTSEVGALTEANAILPGVLVLVRNTSESRQRVERLPSIRFAE